MKVHRDSILTVRERSASQATSSAIQWYPKNTIPALRERRPRVAAGSVDEVVMHETMRERMPAIAEACRRHRVVRLDVFGSAARGTNFDPLESDADFVVDLGEDYGLDEYLGLKADLERMLGRSVDLVTRRSLECGTKGRLDAQIDAETELVYER